MLTLPLAKYLKDFFPGIKIGFLGKPYTRAVIETCRYIDQYIDLEDFLTKPVSIYNEPVACILHVFPQNNIAQRAKKINIPLRVGTENRLYHWLTCNKLIRLSRRNSFLHESILNLAFLKAFDIDKQFSLEDAGNAYGFTDVVLLKDSFQSLIDKNRFNIIIHPTTQGSAREWGLDNFSALIESLDKTKFKIFISGTTKDKEALNNFNKMHKDEVTDITGLMSLSQFISFIKASDGLIANSTGPLHIAAALNKYAFGIFAPLWPINPVRWGPAGKNAKSFVIHKKCNACINNPVECTCIKKVEPALIAVALEEACKVTQQVKERTI